MMDDVVRETYFILDQKSRGLKTGLHLQNGCLRKLQKIYRYASNSRKLIKTKFCDAFQPSTLL